MEIRIVLPPNDTVLVRKYFNIRLVYSALIFYDVVEHVLNVYISVLLVGIGGHPVEVFQKMAQRFLNRSSIKIHAIAMLYPRKGDVLVRIDIVAGHLQHFENLGLHRIFFIRTFTAIPIFLSSPISLFCQQGLILFWDDFLSYQRNENVASRNVSRLGQGRCGSYYLVSFDLRGTSDTSQDHSLGYKKCGWPFFFGLSHVSLLSRRGFSLQNAF